LQKWLLYYTCIFPIILYGFQLWSFKGVSIKHNISELNKTQRRAALWIIGTFKTFPLAGIKAIARLILVFLYFRKLNGWHYLRYFSILYNYTINFLLDPQYAKNLLFYCFTIPNLTNTQRSKLKSPVLDINNCLNKITDFFISFYPSFSPGLRLVNHFINRIAFHFSKDKDIYKYNLNNVFQSSQTTPYHTTVICHIWWQSQENQHCYFYFTYLEKLYCY